MCKCYFQLMLNALCYVMFSYLYIVTLSVSKTKTRTKNNNRWQFLANKNKSTKILNKQCRQQDYKKTTTWALAINWWFI